MAPPAAATWPFDLSQERQTKDFLGRAGDRSDRSGGDATQSLLVAPGYLQIHRGSRKSRNINHGRKYHQKNDFPRNMVNNINLFQVPLIKINKSTPQGNYSLVRSYHDVRGESVIFLANL
jgi:hypothetical protein